MQHKLSFSDDFDITCSTTLYSVIIHEPPWWRRISLDVLHFWTRKWQGLGPALPDIRHVILPSRQRPPVICQYLPLTTNGACATPSIRRQVTRLPKLRTIIVFGLSEYISTHFTVPDVDRTVQHGSRDQHRFCTGLGKTDRGMPGRCHPAQTSSKLVVERIHACAARVARASLSLERHPRSL